MDPTLPVNGPLLGHARIRHYILSVYHGDPPFLAQLPTPEAAPAPAPFDIHGNFTSPTYASPNTPHIMFIPAIRPWYGPLFSRLNYRCSTIPIIQHGDEKWGLPCDTMDEWYTLEWNLRKVLKAMMDTSLVLVRTTVGFPNQWGYAKRYATQQSARTSIFRAISGFLPLIGHLSMFFWLMEQSNVERDSGGAVRAVHDLPDWRETVCSKAGVHRQWFTDLEGSVVADWNVPRLGAIFDFTGCTPESVNAPREFDCLIPAIIATRLPIPLYIIWGEIMDTPTVFVPHGLRSMHFVPNKGEIRYLHRLPGVRVAFSRWITSIGPDKAITIASCRKSDPYVAPPSLEIHSPAPPPPAAPAPPAALSPRLSTLEPSSVPASQPFPPVERYSGQREGEEMEAFFLRRQEKNAQTAAREKPQEKQRREQKEANAQKGQVPGRKGARVYVWDKSNGHYIRRAAGRSNYDDVWEEYGPDQRRYDSFHDEWDVCEQFGAPAEVEDWDGSDGYGGDEDDDGLSEMLPRDVVLESSAAHTSEADLDRVHHITPISATESEMSFVVPIAPTFKEMVYLRYGCTVTKNRSARRCNSHPQNFHLLFEP
ncbi:hypothetical protein DFH06DRAFT_1323744 [Mycena polygramma]|nr:hypothetical protein DFH06DRAFT_1323744 [Mycena polygramma]